jgi:hypothetical protein
LTGIILFSLGVAWWPSEEIVTPQAFATLFTYNLFAAFYFGYLRVGRGFVSHLLWPACPLHALLALLLARPAYESVRSQWLGSWFPEVKRQTASEIVLGLKKNPETTSKETQANSQLEKTEKHSTKETKL